MLALRCFVSEKMLYPYCLFPLQGVVNDMDLAAQTKQGRLLDFVRCPETDFSFNPFDIVVTSSDANRDFTSQGRLEKRHRFSNSAMRLQLLESPGVDPNPQLTTYPIWFGEEVTLKALKNDLQQFPDDWKKRLKLAELLDDLGHQEQAIAEYCRVLTQRPHCQTVWLNLGDILQQLGREAEAVAVYKRALTFAQNVASRLHLRGAIAACARLTQTAVHAFKSAAMLEPNNASHWLALGLTHVEQEAPAAAAQAFDRVLSLKPNDPTALTHSCAVLSTIGQDLRAEWQANRLLTLCPHNIQALKWLADRRCDRRLVWGEEGKRTRQLIRTLLRLAPDNAKAQESLAYYRIVQRDSTKGLLELQKFTEAHSNDPESWHCYARCLSFAGNNQVAGQAIINAYTLDRNNYEVYQQACKILPAAGKIEELQPLMAEMLDRFPQRWSTWTTVGRILVEIFQEPDRGCAISAVGTQLQPHLPDSWFQHGRTLSIAGKHRQAVEVLEQGWEQVPMGAKHQLLAPAAAALGESYRRLGDEARSLQWWAMTGQQAKALLNFNPAQAHYWQGKTLENLGDWASAAQAYRTALSQQLLHPLRGEVEAILMYYQTFKDQGACI